MEYITGKPAEELKEQYELVGMPSSAPLQIRSNPFLLRKLDFDANLRVMNKKYLEYDACAVYFQDRSRRNIECEINEDGENHLQIGLDTEVLQEYIVTVQALKKKGEQNE